MIKDRDRARERELKGRWENDEDDENDEGWLTLPAAWIRFNAPHEDGDLDNRSSLRRRPLLTGHRCRSVRVLFRADSAGTRNGGFSPGRHFHPSQTRPSKYSGGPTRARPRDGARGQDNRISNRSGRFRRNEHGICRILPEQSPGPLNNPGRSSAEG